MNLWKAQWVRWLRLREPIGAAEAERLAHGHCLARGWGWREPVVVTDSGAFYCVGTSADRLGGNCEIIVDVFDGTVHRSGLIPR